MKALLTGRHEIMKTERRQGLITPPVPVPVLVSVSCLHVFLLKKIHPLP
jgi:hypothetical protein